MADSSLRGRSWRAKQRADPFLKERLQQYEREKYKTKKAKQKQLTGNERNALKVKWREKKRKQREKVKFQDSCVFEESQTQVSGITMREGDK